MPSYFLACIFPHSLSSAPSQPYQGFALRGDTAPQDPCLTPWQTQVGRAQFCNAWVRKRHGLHRYSYISTATVVALCLSLCLPPSIHSFGFATRVLSSAVHSFYTHNTVVTVIPRIFNRRNGVTDLLRKHSSAPVHSQLVWLSSTSSARLCADKHQLYRGHIVWPELLSVLSLLPKTWRPLTSSTVTSATPWAPTSTVKCTLPASISGKAYSVTPVVHVPRSVSSLNGLVRETAYTCDPIPAASINKGNFQFACKSLRGKDVGDGFHTISWNLPTAASVTIKPYTFNAGLPTSTPTYVVNPGLAKTTLIPKTDAFVTVTTSTTRTVSVSTSTVSVATKTSTCFTTVTVAPPLSGRRLRRAGSANLHGDADPELLESGSVVDDHTDVPMDLNERAAAATPTICKPDFTYPPFGITTIYVKSMSTYTWTYRDVRVSTFFESAITATTSYAAWTTKTVTVVRTTVS